MIEFRPPIVCLVTNRKALAPDARTIDDEFDALERQVAEAVEAGVDWVQVREPDLEARAFAQLVKRLATRTRGRARLLVNDRVDVAIAAGADGVHLKGDGPPAIRVREIVPADWLIGRSIHSVSEARRTGGEDFLVFGTVFESRSKAGSPAAGIDALADAAVVASVPLLAIGGVTAARAAACRDAGAAGVAAIEVFLPAGRTPAAMGAAAAVSAFRNAWRG